MRRWKTSFLLLAATALCLAQTESQITSDDVRRVARHVSCQCGSCQEDANCMMSSGQCGFCKPARTKIFKMQQAGMSDQNIADDFIREYGSKIYRADPSALGWLVPYGTLVIGILVVVWFVRRYYHPVAAGAVAAAAAGTGQGPADDPLGKYRDQIEQDLAHLD
jgi:cytochrome c-type biogenesis protein CcmH/NrfF